MDSDLKAYLAAMEARLEAGQAAMETRLEAGQAAMETRLEAGQAAMEARLEAGQAAIEARLMGRINDVQERMIQGFAATDKVFAAIDKRVGNIERAFDTIVEMHRATNMLLGTLVSNVSELSGRVTRLENKQ